MHRHGNSLHLYRRIPAETVTSLESARKSIIFLVTQQRRFDEQLQGLARGHRRVCFHLQRGCNYVVRVQKRSVQTTLIKEPPQRWWCYGNLAYELTFRHHDGLRNTCRLVTLEFWKPSSRFQNLAGKTLTGA